MSFEVEAVYENGALKPDHPLPLDEHERVKIIVKPETTLARRSYGIIGWTGDQQAIRHIALDPETGVQEPK